MHVLTAFLELFFVNSTLKSLNEHDDRQSENEEVGIIFPTIFSSPAQLNQLQCNKLLIAIEIMIRMSK